jgi:tRNA A37 threonylcarbamoyladenosine biosynthesis protein TsaE
MKKRLPILLFYTTLVFFHPDFINWLFNTLLAIINLSEWTISIVEWKEASKKRPTNDESMEVFVSRKERVKQARKQRFLTFAMRVLLVLVIMSVMTM